MTPTSADDTEEVGKSVGALVNGLLSLYFLPDVNMLRVFRLLHTSSPTISLHEVYAVKVNDPKSYLSATFSTQR